MKQNMKKESESLNNQFEKRVIKINSKYDQFEKLINDNLKRICIERKN